MPYGVILISSRAERGVSDDSPYFFKVYMYDAKDDFLLVGTLGKSDGPHDRGKRKNFEIVVYLREYIPAYTIDSANGIAFDRNRNPAGIIKSTTGQSNGFIPYEKLTFKGTEFYIPSWELTLFN